MNTSQTPQKQHESGFTLMELLVVILIIGILAAVAIPAFMNQRQKANDSTVESDVRNIATQIETMLISEPNAESITVESYKGGSSTVMLASIGNSVAAVPSSNYAAIKVGEQTENLTLSAGVIVKGQGNANAFIIKGAHQNGGEYSYSSEEGELTSWLVYDSANGGLQDELLSEEAVSAEDRLLQECQEGEYTQECAELDAHAFANFVHNWIENNDPERVVERASLGRYGTIVFTTNGGRNEFGRTPFTLPTQNQFSNVSLKLENERVLLSGTPNGLMSVDVRSYVNYSEADAYTDAEAFVSWVKQNAPAGTYSASYQPSRGTVKFSYMEGKSGRSKTVGYTGFSNGGSAVTGATYSFDYNSASIKFRGESRSGKTYPLVFYTFTF